MTEYITKEVLKERFARRLVWLKKDIHDKYSEGLYDSCEYDAHLIDEIPAAAVSPVLHGDWKGYSPHRSICGEEALSRDNGTLHGAYFLTDYCPNCGAKMDGGTTDEL